MADTTLERLQTHLADRYAFERELGRGGMATVFLARDIKHDRKVAVKVLHPDLSASIGGERFEREIRVAGRLQHPHILGMYDSGVSDGLLYYVMPFVEGESLRDRLDREGQLSVEDALQITLEVADALEYAHKQQVIHRDIKPENVLLSGGHALVADFGIARAVEDGAQQLTQTGMALGTPTYMAPEQGMGEKVGVTADIYSLGCMLFEMLAGEPPFSGKNASAILAKHVMEQVPSLRIIRQSVPEEVEYAIFCSLGKSPADRPQSAAAFAALLVAAPMPAGATSTRMMTMRHTTARRTTSGMTSAFGVAAPAPVPLWKRPMVLAIALLVLAGGGFGAYKLTAGGKPVPLADSGGLSKKRIAVLYFQTGDSLATLADGLTEALIENLNTIPSLAVISAGGVGQYRGNDSIPPEDIGKALNAGTLVKGTLDQQGDKIRVSIRLLDGNSGVDFGDPKSFMVDGRNFAAVRDSTAREVADLIRERIGGEVLLKEQRRATSNNDAWLLVQRAERLRKQAAATKGDSVLLIRAQADTLFAQAETLDPKWPDPIIGRARLAYETSRRNADPLEAKAPIDLGLAHVNRALALQPQDPNALELRGNLQYWRYLVKVDAEKEKQSALLAAARADLERVTELNPNQAGAWASLSHLYYFIPEVPPLDIYQAAEKAWNADAFLSNAQTVLNRLILAAYDLEDWTKANRWCDEMQRRYPASAQAPRCQLYLMTSRAKEADVALAWKLADSIAAMAPKPAQQFERFKSDLLVAAVLARAGQGDSAKRVAERSRGNPEIDPNLELPQYAAFVSVLRSDTTAALANLKVFLSKDDDRRKAIQAYVGWWYRPIEKAPGFQKLIAN
ncbi:MAG: protein kinase [Gemmatimonadales bacterium]|nr:protein kinase [Gemmatimonadales bacterium]